MHISKPVLALAVGLGAGAVQAETVAIASRPDLTLSLANQLADATLCGLPRPAANRCGGCGRPVRPTGQPAA